MAQGSKGRTREGLLDKPRTMEKGGSGGNERAREGEKGEEKQRGLEELETCLVVSTAQLTHSSCV